MASVLVVLLISPGHINVRSLHALAFCIGSFPSVVLDSWLCLCVCGWMDNMNRLFHDVMSGQNANFVMS